MDTNSPILTAEQAAAFEADGYIIVPQFFSGEQIEILHEMALADTAMGASSQRLDAEGVASKVLMSNDISDNVYSAFAANERIVAAAEQLMSDEVYHFHHKMMLKEARVGGAWEWHQDYGYWYENQHVMFPDMISVAIAVDRANRENGCLQVLRGSHKCGRIGHGTVGDQSGADMERVQALIDFYNLQVVYAELEPGDGLFFHCNLLHRSDRNRSENARWTLICCYNTKHNDKYQTLGPEHPAYSPLARLPDSRILEIGAARKPTTS